MAKRGRRPLPRGIVPFDVPSLTTPERVLLDSSFVVEALLSGEPRHAECSDALVDLAVADSELVYSSLLEAELLEAAYRAKLSERYGKKKWKDARKDGRARRRAGRLAGDALDAWREIVRILPSRQIDPSEVADGVSDLMQEHALGSYDAVHVATAIHAGVRDVYTLDSGFAGVPSLTLYTVTSKLPRMRGIRAGSIK